MPTDNPRIAAYLPPQTFKCLKAFCKENRLSISEGVGRIMSEYFGVLPNELPSGTDWENRLQAVEGELVKVVGVAERIIAVESAIATLQKMVSELHGKLHTSTLKTDGKTPPSSPSNTPEVDTVPESELQSTTQELSKIPSDYKRDTQELNTVNLSEIAISTPDAGSNSPTELQGSLLQTNTIIPRESTESTPETNSISPNKSLNNTPEIDSNLPSSSPNSTL